MTRLRLVTFNIAHGRGLSPYQGLHSRRRIERNLARIGALLRELSPDVVALQEIDENSRWAGGFDHLEHLRAAAGFDHAIFGINTRRTGHFHLSYGNAILSRHPILAWENITFGSATIGEKGFLFAELDVHGRHVPVVNLHLHFGARARRLAQLERLTLYLTDKHLARQMHWAMRPIICGDMNNPATQTADATAVLFEHLLGHGRYTLHPQHQRTFPSVWPRRTLDFVFLPPSCTEASCEVVRCFLSDHRPVVVDFALKN